MRAFGKPARAFVGREFRIALLQAQGIRKGQFQQAKARRIEHMPFVGPDHFAVARGVLAALHAIAERAGFQGKAVQRVDQRGFARAGLAGKRVIQPAQRFFQRVHARARFGAHRHGRHARAAVRCHQFPRVRRVFVRLVDHQPHGQILRAREQQLPVGQEQIRRGRTGGKHQYQRVQIRHGRAQQGVFAGQNLRHPAFFAVAFEAHAIAHQRRKPGAAKFGLRAQREFPLPIVHGVKPAHALHNRSATGNHRNHPASICHPYKSAPGVRRFPRC